MTMNAQGVEKETVVTALAMAMLTIQVQGKSHIIKMDKYETRCKKLYLWMWIMCTPTTHNKIKGLKEFVTLDRARKLPNLIKMTRSIMLQFESHNDLATVLTRYLKCIMDCR